MSETFITIKNYYDRIIRIDDAEGNVASLPLRIRRFTKEQRIEFAVGLQRCKNRNVDRYFSRKPDGDEQEMVPVSVNGIATERPKVDDAEIRRRRLVEMSPEDRARIEAIEAEDEKYATEFITKAVSDHVWVRPGVRLMFEDAQGAQRQLSTGADLVEAFAGQSHVMGEFLRAVEEENTLSAEKKTLLRSLSALTASSPASTPKASGGEPGAIAAPADGKDSAESGPATAA